jgi:hypothetical protein
MKPTVERFTLLLRHEGRSAALAVLIGLWSLGCGGRDVSSPEIGTTASALSGGKHGPPRPCQPSTCAQEKITCGRVPDGCGGWLTCGSVKTIDFEKPSHGAAIKTGAVITSQWLADGVTFACTNARPAPSPTPGKKSAARAPTFPDACVAFDSAHPGDGDRSLGSPNQDFGGPGKGAGGKKGSPAANEFALKNVLVITDDRTDGDHDGCFDRPSAAKSGGTVTVAFSPAVEVGGVRLMDIGPNEHAIVRATTGAGTFAQPAVSYEHNSVQSVTVGRGGVSKLAIELDGAAAIAELSYCLTCPAGDDDGDGICNTTDRCPQKADPGQEDADGDGVGDACDACPADASDDADGDGACGGRDNCPLQPNPKQEDRDGDGLGDACDICPDDAGDDSDGDGVCGHRDNCPNKANAEQKDTDGDGAGDVCDPCPADRSDDVDGDGLCAQVDNCPNASNIGQIDSDGDGLGDECDKCPQDPSNDADGDGICGNGGGCPPGSSCPVCKLGSGEDADGDGICGAADDCPGVANADQTDADQDGRGNACDVCAFDSHDDADKDGRCAEVDNCPAAANPQQVDGDGDGIGDACDPCPLDATNDHDHDGVCERLDNCPNDSNPDQADSDADGVGDICDQCPRDRDNDRDHDGICGEVDNCPSSPNPGQADSDADGIGDACDPCPLDTANDVDGDGRCAEADNCPLRRNPDQADGDSDAIGDSCDKCPSDPENDRDGDGVCGDVDNCPAFANATQVDTDGDHAGDACDLCLLDPANDADADGVCGDIDNCPTLSNAAQSDVDGDGKGDTCDNCPAKANSGQEDGDHNGRGDICERTVVPALVGLTEAEARQRLTAAGLKTGAITAAASGSLPRGTVAVQVPPAGQEVDPGTPVSLAIVTNRAPRLAPVADVVVDEQGCLSLVLHALDDDNDELSYHLARAPLGMAVSKGGVITWFPGPGVGGAHAVEVEVKDTEGGADRSAFTVTVAARPDHLPPTIDVFAPAQVRLGGAFTVDARASDDRGVAGLRFFVDGAQVHQVAGTAERFSFAAPSSLRPTKVEVRAQDMAGNVATTLVDIATVDAIDTQPPAIKQVRAPAQLPLDGTATLVVEATDDYGIVDVTAGWTGEPPVVADRLSDAQWLVRVPLPGSTQVGETREVVVRAVDGAGGKAERALSITATAPGPRAPSGPVTLEPPAHLEAGVAARIGVAAVDVPFGVAAVTLRGGGATLSTQTAPPYAFAWAAPNGLQPGDAIRLDAISEAFDGVRESSSPVCVPVKTTGVGQVLLSVYDDATGRPLVGARATLLGGTNGPKTVDARGATSWSFRAGSGILRADADGYTPVYRTFTAAAGVVRRAFDARLTRRNPVQAADNLQGGRVVVDAEQSVLEYEPGALGAVTGIGLALLGEQGLPALLPPGWSPLWALDVAPAGGLNRPAKLRVARGRVDGELADAVAVQHVPPAGWKRIALSVDEVAGTLELTLSSLGAVAIVKADGWPEKPPLPAVGEELLSGAGVAVPADVQVQIAVTPEVLFLGMGDVGTFKPGLPLGQSVRSGTQLLIGFSESYLGNAGKVWSPPHMEQSVVLYRRPDQIQATLGLSPWPGLDDTFDKGVISLDAMPYDESVAGSAIIGPAGGTLHGADGAVVTFPEGIFPIDTAVNLTAGKVDRPEVLQQIEISAAGACADFPAPAALEAFIPGGVAPDTHVLATLHVVVEGEGHDVVVGLATMVGDRAVVAAGALGLPFPGVRGCGVYKLWAVRDPLAWLTGQVRESGQPARALLTGGGLGFAAMSHPGLGTYVLPVAPAPGEVVASAPSGAGAAAVYDVPASDAIVTADLDLGPQRLKVVSVSPADRATSAPVSAVVTLSLSGPIDRTTITPESVRLEHNGTTTEIDRTLLDGGRTLVLTPRAALAPNSSYTVALSTGVKSRAGQTLLGREADETFRAHFDTLDATPPPPPTPGLITAAVPVQGSTTVTGTAGATEPGTVVSVFNPRTGETTSKPAGSDGSFSIAAPAETTDGIEIIFTDAAGNSTRYNPGRFRNADGTTVVGKEGGSIPMPGDLTLEIAPAAVAAGTPVKLVKVDDSRLKAPVANFLMRAGTFEVNLGGQPAKGKVGMSLPIPAGVTIGPSDQIFFFAEKPSPLGPLLELVEIGKVEGNRIKTASWPYCGLAEVAGLLQVAIADSFVAAGSVSVAGGLAGSVVGGGIIVEAAGMAKMIFYLF